MLFQGTDLNLTTYPSKRDAEVYRGTCWKLVNPLLLINKNVNSTKKHPHKGKNILIKQKKALPQDVQPMSVMSPYSVDPVSIKMNDAQRPANTTILTCCYFCCNGQFPVGFNLFINTHSILILYLSRILVDVIAEMLL